MVTKAYLLVETLPGEARVVVEALRSMEGIESVDLVTGPYDIIAVIVGSSVDEVGKLITKKIHTVQGVVRTITSVAVEV